jgi:hypothetical protein
MTFTCPSARGCTCLKAMKWTQEHLISGDRHLPCWQHDSSTPLETTASRKSRWSGSSKSCDCSRTTKALDESSPPAPLPWDSAQPQIAVRDCSVKAFCKQLTTVVHSTTYLEEHTRHYPSFRVAQYFNEVNYSDLSWSQPRAEELLA